MRVARCGFRKGVSTGMFLAITSAEDVPITQPEEVVWHLKNSRHVVVRYGSHASDDCAMQGRPQWRCARRFTRSVPSV